MLKIFKITLSIILLISISLGNASASCPDIATAIKQINGVATLSAPTTTSPYQYTGTSTYDSSEVDYYTTILPTAVTPVYQLKSLAAALGVGLPLVSANADTVSCIYLGSWNGTTPQVDAGWNQAIVIKSNATPTQQVAVNTDVEGLPSGATVKVTMTNTAGGTPVSKTVNTGIASFATLTVGSYTVAADNYTSGSDTYYPNLSNPYTIDPNHTTVTITYSKNPPPPPVASMWFAPYKDLTVAVDWTKTPPVPNVVSVEQNSGAKYFTLAFINSDQRVQNHCTPGWGGDSTNMPMGWGADSINQLRTLGGDVAISFGGENGVTLANACTNVNDLYAIYKNAMIAYKPVFLDFDIEGTAVSDTTANIRRFQALQMLLKDYPNLKISLTLPANVDGLSSDGIIIAQQAKQMNVPIAYYNLMLMSFHEQRLPDPLYKTIVAGMNAGVTQLQAIYTDKTSDEINQMMRATLRLGIDYDSSVFRLTDVTPLVQAAKASDWGGLAYWSMEVDSNFNCKAAKPDTADYGCTGTTTQPYEYTKAFLAAIASGSKFDTQNPKK